MKKPSNYIPERGDVVWLNFFPQRGREQSGQRPALILSPKEYNGKTSLALCCPITRQIKGYPFESVIPDSCKTEGAVLSDHIKSLDWAARKAQFVEIAPQTLLTDVLAKLSCLL